MYTTLFYTVGLPFLIALGTTLGLHLLGRVFFLSSHRRSRKLFANTHWLPLRFSSEPLVGEEVEFQSSGRLTLRGVFIAHCSAVRKGTILFCHEFNGSHLSIGPYARQLSEAGFDILTFDFRNHGKSDLTPHTFPTPWVMSTDMDDVKAAIDYLFSRPGLESEGIGIFGFGKGATIALCAAGNDRRVRSVVLDAPMPESKLFDKNCLDVLVKSMKLSRRRTTRFFTLFGQAVLYSLACPVLSVVYTWRRFVFGIWYGCRFVDPNALAKKVRQPIMIVHGHVDSNIRPDQIQAFRNRMSCRSRLWFVTERERDGSTIVSEDCSRQVVRFFEDATL